MEEYILKSWLPPSLGWALLLLLISLVTSSYVWRTGPSAVHFGTGGTFIRLAPLTVLLIPIMVVCGFGLMLFPLGWRDSVVLRSRALPVPVRTIPDCFIADMNELLAREPARHQDKCENAPFQPSDRVIDAGPVVDRAIDLFTSGAAFRPEEIEARIPRVLQALRSAVERALRQDPPVVSDSPQAPDRPRSGIPRWLVEAIETAVVEGVALQRNVRNVVVERHIAATDEVSADQWRRMKTSLSRGDEAHVPSIRIEEGSVRASDAYMSVLGQPWLQHTGSGANLYVLIRHGRENAKGRLLLFAGDKELPLGCGTANSDVENCVSRIDSWLPETTRLAIAATPGPVPPGPYAVRLEVSGTTPVSTKALDVSELGPLTISSGADREVIITMNCLLGNREAPSEYFRANVNLPGKREVRSSRGADADVLVERDAGRLWVYPTDIRVDVLDSIKRSVTVERDVFESTMRDGERNYGLMLFPSVSRSDGLPPATPAITDMPLAPTRTSKLDRADVDPANYLASPPSTWFARYDARPVLFAYAKANYVQFSQRIDFTSLLPVGWRVDTADGREGRRPATVWLFGLDLARQGLLLDEQCKGARQPLALSASPAFEATAVYEPTYEEARFFPFWAAVVSAARESASQQEWLARSTRPSEPIVILDASMRAGLKLRVARTGMMLVIAGLILHALSMIWSRYRAFKKDP